MKKDDDKNQNFLGWENGKKATSLTIVGNWILPWRCNPDSFFFPVKQTLQSTIKSRGQTVSLGKEDEYLEYELSLFWLSWNEGWYDLQVPLFLWMASFVMLKSVCMTRWDTRESNKNRL